MAAPGFVFHAQTMADATEGLPDTNCEAPLPFVENLTPGPGDDYVLRFRVQLQGASDQARVYYTIDGTAPAGAFGVGSNTTQVVAADYTCVVTNGGTTLDILTATLPAQSASTTVRYIVAAWDSGGGPELFGNSGLCEECEAFTNATQATTFEYTVAGPPEIITQPENASVTPGTPVTFTVEATGAEPLTYQWFFNDVPLTGETNTTLSIANADTGTSGTYVVAVSNPLGTTFSDEAKLSLILPPTILAQPEDTLVPLGGTAVFIVAAGGTEPLSYQWFLEGSPVTDGTNAILAVVDVQPSDGGAYTVEVSNQVGSVTSDPAQLTLGERPGFLVEPVDLVVPEGEPAIFSASATGTEPLTYQWFFGETAIEGATNPVYAVESVQASDAGPYTLEVSNEFGQAFSSPATLTVLLPPTILVAPIDQVTTQSLAAVFSVQAEGAEPLAYQWYFNATNLLVGATNATLTVTNAQAEDDGFYSVEIRNDLGTVTSEPAKLDVLLLPSIVAQPSDRMVIEGLTAVFGVVVEGTPPVTYQWRKDGEELTGQTNNTLVITEASPEDEGIYDVLVLNPAGVVLSRPALLTVLLGPTITQQPESLSVTQGLDAVFAVTATGSEPLAYRWFFNETNLLAGATNATLTLESVTAAEEGSYQVLVSNLVDTVLSDPATLVVRRPPTILVPPQSTSVGEGEQASFTVVADGEAPLTYQWRFEGETIAGADTNTLQIKVVGPEDLGAYTVVVSNALGSVESQPAFLSFRAPPSIEAAPQDLVVTNGQDALLAVEVSGTEPFSFQWFFNGTTPIPDATNTSLLISEAQLEDAGEYSVVITNLAGSVTSDPATLTVLAPPLVPDEPVQVSTTNQAAILFSVPVTGTSPFTYQWFFGEENPLADATNATLLLDPVGLSDAGDYQVLIQNDLGQAVGSVSLTVRGEDFGDAPDPPLPTLRASNGARHLLVPGFHLGDSADVDDNGQPDVEATGDDLDGSPDEDGVFFLSPVARGLMAELAVVASSNGFLNAWVDFDNDGNWSGPADQIFTDLLLTPGTNRLAFAVPPDAAVSDTFARFRFNSTGGLGVTGPAADGEVEDYRLALLPSIDLAVAVSDQGDPQAVGGTVTVTATVTNVGLSQATGVTLTQVLPRDTEFVSATASQGACTLDGSLLTCSLGNLAVQAGRSVTLQWRSLAPGTRTNVLVAAANEIDADPSNNIGIETSVATYQIPTLANLDAIITPDFDDGPAFPYPTTTVVSGLTSTVQKVTVRLIGITHTFPDDLDILLVGPQGQNVLLMSDAGAGAPFTPISDVTLTFDDDADQILPNADQIESGTFRPTNWGSPETVPFAPPAPGEPYGNALAVFAGTDPNGPWSLYVMDDLPEDSGFIVGGWELNLTLADPIHDLALRITDAPDPVAVESNITYTVTVENLGPSAAQGVVVENPVPPGTLFTSATVEGGDCAFEDGIIRCDLGAMAPLETRVATFRLAPTSGATVLNTARVSAEGADLQAANNEATASTEVILVNDLELTGQVEPDPVLLGQELTYTLAVTNLGPFPANGVVVSDLPPPSLQGVGVASTVGSCTNLGGQILCELGSLAVGEGAVLVVTGTPTAIGAITNIATVTETESDFNPANNRLELPATVTPAADLAVGLAAAPQPVIVGQVLAYTVTVTNLGPAQAGAVRLEDELPPTVSFLQALPDQGSCTNEAGRVTCELGPLDADATTTVVIEVLTELAGMVTNRVSASSTEGDPFPGNNTAQRASLVDPAADLAVDVQDRMDPVLLGEPMFFTVQVTNVGPNTANGITLTNLLSPGLTIVSALPSQGSCTNDGGRVVCDLGTLAAGSQALLELTLQASAAGDLGVESVVTANEADLVPDNNRSADSSSVIIDTGIFFSSETFAIREAGPAALYPSTIFVAGVTVRVDSVSVTIPDLNHTYASDLDILLVGPTGHAVMLMSDVGGASTLVNTSLTFSDEADSFLPEFGAIASGTYRPTQHDPDSDTLAAPAPEPPYATNLAGFQGLDPNGIWSLYVHDDFAKDGGFVLDGWTLRFATLDPLADLEVGLEAPTAVAVGSNFTYTVTITNHGPSIATGIVLTDLPPLSGIDQVTIETDDGTCTNDNGTITCDLDDLAARASAAVRVSGRVFGTNTLTNQSSVTGDEIDVRLSNNQVTSTTLVQDPPLITLNPEGLTVTNGVEVVFRVEATGTGPLRFQWFRDGEALAGQVNAVLSLSDVQGPQSGDYTVRVSNEVGSVESVPATLVVLVPLSITEQPQDLLIVARNTARFNVGVTGSEPRAYQWFYNGDLLPGATLPELVLPEVARADAGEYQVVVSNILNVVTSRVATLEVQVLDFGDAPSPGFPTLLADNGARHNLVPGVFLGNTIDADPDGIPDLLAQGDDLREEPDEDGVRFLTALVPGQPAQLEVVASTNGFLDAWLDANASGTWLEAGEQVLTNAPLTAGTNLVVFEVPVNSLETNLTHARFRFSTLGNLAPDGPAPDGEVEDYAVPIIRLADVAVTVTDQPDPARFGFNVVYTIGVTNHGPLTASNIVIDISLTPGLSILGVENSLGECTNLVDTLCTIDLLDPGQGGVIEIVGLALRAVPVRLTATALAMEADPNPTNNTFIEITDIVQQPALLRQPQSQTVVAGATTSFDVVATGNLLRYQWLLGSVELPGATNASLTLTNVSTDQAGSYSVRVSNVVGTVVSDPALLTVLVPPTFLEQPQSRTIAPGEAVTFSVSAIGTEPLSYLWQRNGQPIPGATNASLTLTNTVVTQAGDYTVRVTNPAAAVESEPARLNFTGPPVIIEQPQSRTNFAGSTATLSVLATGSEPLTAQWYFNLATPLAGATNLPLVLPNVQTTNAGLYQVVLANSEGSVTSEVAQLIVFEADFGDAPSDRYPTLFAQDGAHHFFNVTFALGPGVDFDPDGQPNDDATGDNIFDGISDENGLTFNEPFLVGQTVSFDIEATRVGLLNAWLDFDANDSWADPGDQIFTNLSLNPGVTTLTIRVPETAATGRTFARFRFSSARDLSFTGPAPNGEVEDYAIDIRPAIDVGLAMEGPGTPVVEGEAFDYSLQVTNAGPSPATDVVVTDTLPAGLIVQDLTSSQGNCLLEANRVTCELGSLSPGAGAQLVFSVLTQPGLGTLTNVAEVSAAQIDVLGDNNTATTVTVVTGLPFILTQPASQVVTNNADVMFDVVADGLPPLTYQWRFKGEDLPGATNATLQIAGVQPSDFGTYQVVVSNPNGSVLSEPALLMGANAPLVVTLPASSLTSTGAVLNGSVNPNGLPTVVFFEWGTSTNYGNLTPARMLGGEMQAMDFSERIGGLEAGTTYHFRLAATNLLGTTLGQDVLFSWDSTPPVITRLNRLPDGSVHLEISAVAGQFYQVQGSTNVVDFQGLGPAEPVAEDPGAFEFTDEEAALFLLRFYRVIGP